jgi:electron transfer flavoprotein alpha subunit
MQGRVNEVTFELLGKGLEVSRSLGGALVGVLVGREARGLMPSLGAADVIYVADKPELREFIPEAWCSALESGLKQAKPRAVLFGSTSVGLDLLSFLSARAGLPCLDNCTRLEVRDGQLVATSQIYGGKVFAEVALSEETTLVAVVPGSFPAEAGKVPAKPGIATTALPVELPAPRATFRKWIEPPPGDIDITKVPVLVAIGRGIKSADNVSLAEDLAQLLGGTVCGSRPVIDQGWLLKTRQVGKSGMLVKPKLYLALGISGAPEHVEGMKGADLIVAVNSDTQAPIFNVAHYGAVADLFDVVPILTEEVRRRQSSSAA